MNSSNRQQAMILAVMSNSAGFRVRTASPEDAEAVRALLHASYQSLMALGYEPVLFARALPILTKANPVLLSCGTWYVVEMPVADGALIGCGGWTRQRPGAPNEPVDPALPRSAPPDQSARSARRARPLKRTALLAPVNGINAPQRPDCVAGHLGLELRTCRRKLSL